ncbi:MAG: NAD-dependent epimerase/dehydratase family protein, partial [Acidobacteria bacterium]
MRNEDGHALAGVTVRHHEQLAVPEGDDVVLTLVLQALEFFPVHVADAHGGVQPPDQPRRQPRRQAPGPPGLRNLGSRRCLGHLTAIGWDNSADLDGRHGTSYLACRTGGFQVATGRIVITGGAGFIGSHLCEHYVSAGWDVICLDNLSTGSADNIAGLMGKPGFHFVKVDVTEFIHVAGKVDAILHF